VRGVYFSRKSADGCAILLFLAAFGWALDLFVKGGPALWIVIASALGGWLCVVRPILRVQRRGSLLKKYGDVDDVERIMARFMWVGQSEEQLRDSLGAPSAVDQRVLATKVKETWKYHPTGKSRYGLRVFLDDGIVVGWKQAGD